MALAPLGVVLALTLVAVGDLQDFAEVAALDRRLLVALAAFCAGGVRVGVAGGEGMVGAWWYKSAGAYCAAVAAASSNAAS